MRTVLLLLTLAALLTACSTPAPKPVLYLRKDGTFAMGADAFKERW